MLPTTQFAYRKGLGPCDALLCVAHTLQSVLEMGQEAGIVQRDFSAAFDRINHNGVRGLVMSVLTQIISNRSQYLVVDGCRIKMINAVSGVPQGSVLGLQLFFLCTVELFPSVETKLNGYADDFTLIAVVTSPGERVPV